LPGHLFGVGSLIRLSVKPAVRQRYSSGLNLAVRDPQLVTTESPETHLP
jgi:hypothetical protein